MLELWDYIDSLGQFVEINILIMLSLLIYDYGNRSNCLDGVLISLSSVYAVYCINPLAT